MLRTTLLKEWKLDDDWTIQVSVQTLPDGMLLVLAKGPPLSFTVHRFTLTVHGDIWAYSTETGCYEPFPYGIHPEARITAIKVAFAYIMSLLPFAFTEEARAKFEMHIKLLDEEE